MLWFYPFGGYCLYSYMIQIKTLEMAIPSILFVDTGLLREAMWIPLRHTLGKTDLKAQSQASNPKLCSPKYALSSENHIDHGDKISPRLFGFPCACYCLTVCRVECWFPYNVNPTVWEKLWTELGDRLQAPGPLGGGVSKKPIDVNIVIRIVSAVLDKHLLWARPLDP